MKKQLFNKYLRYVSELEHTKLYKGNMVKDETFEAMPSYEGFLLFLVEKKGYEYPDALKEAGEFRGIVNIHSIDYLKRKVSQGVRNAGVFASMINSIQEEMIDETKSQVVINIGNNSNNKILGKDDE